MSASTYHNPIVRRINRRLAVRRIYNLVAPWAFAVSFVCMYGFMGWMGRP
jgi:hypothetical protein